MVGDVGHQLEPVVTKFGKRVHGTIQIDRWIAGIPGLAGFQTVHGPCVFGWLDHVIEAGPLPACEIEMEGHGDGVLGETLDRERVSARSENGGAAGGEVNGLRVPRFAAVLEGKSFFVNRGLAVPSDSIR